MSISAQVSLSFKAGETSYKVNLDIPTSTPTGDAPFNFNVESVPQAPAEGGKPLPPVKLLTVAVGAANQIYVAVSPPKKLLETAAPGIIEDLDVIVEEGDYNKDTNKFAK